MNEVDISEQNLREKYPEVLQILLKDHSRTADELEKAKREKRPPAQDQWNIIWGTNDYLQLGGEGFGEQDQITVEKITGENQLLVRPRAVKEKDIQRQRSKDMAEVFTPGWVCNAQNNLVDEAWFGRKNVFNREYVNENGIHRWEPSQGKILFDEQPGRESTKSWKDYVKDLRLEITCGEAPYLVSRYDCVTGLPIADLNCRVGLLDRKLRVVSENTETSGDWLDWAQEAVKSIYGFEWQGDNLLLAREAILYTVIDYYREKFGKEPLRKSLKYFAYIISWNIWQMDGLKCVLPYSCHPIMAEQMELFSDGEKQNCPACVKGERTGHNGVKCIVCDWTKKGDARKVEFESLLKAKTN